MHHTVVKRPSQLVYNLQLVHKPDEDSRHEPVPKVVDVPRDAPPSRDQESPAAGSPQGLQVPHIRVLWVLPEGVLLAVGASEHPVSQRFQAHDGPHCRPGQILCGGTCMSNRPTCLSISSEDKRMRTVPTTASHAHDMPSLPGLRKRWFAMSGRDKSVFFASLDQQLTPSNEVLASIRMCTLSVPMSQKVIEHLSTL